MNLYQQIQDLNPNSDSCLYTVIAGESCGAKVMICGEQILYSSGNAGVITEHLESLAEQQKSGILTLDDSVIYAEKIGRDSRIVICGGGHVSMPVITIGRMIGCHVTVIEDRPAFADNARRQGADVVLCEPFEDALSRIEGDADTFFVIVTRGHRYDKECLRAIAEKPHAYIGMIGSRRRVAMVKDSLREEGVSAEILDRLYSPIGLKIGAETPEEIGVSIMAEIIQVKNSGERTGGYSRELLKALTEEGRPKNILATIVSRKGSAPREAGTKMLIAPDGTCIGTIGGGCAESEVVSYARTKLHSSGPFAELYTVDMTDSAEDDGMVCGGVIDVFLETV